MIEFAMENYGYNHDDLVIILDGDMFPIRTWNIKELQNDYDVMGIYRTNHGNFSMFWVPFISLNMPKLPDQSAITFNRDVINGYFHDTGSAFHYYLQDHPKLKLKKYSSWDESNTLREKSIKELLILGFTLKEAVLCKSLAPSNSVQFHLDHHLLHFSASSFDLPNHEQKSDCVKRFLNAILK